MRIAENDTCIGRHGALTGVPPAFNLEYWAICCGAPIPNEDASRWASHAEEKNVRLYLSLLRGQWTGKVWCSKAVSRWVVIELKQRRIARFYPSLFLATCPFHLFHHSPVPKWSQCRSVSTITRSRDEGDVLQSGRMRWGMTKMIACIEPPIVSVSHYIADRSPVL